MPPATLPGPEKSTPASGLPGTNSASDAVQDHHHRAETLTLGSARSILVAEDDDDLRTVMQACLEAMGYRVFACPDAEGASQIFRSGVAVDLLLTDIEMPGRSGVELARELTALHPPLPVVFASGSLVSAEVKSEMQARRWSFLGKPYGLSALLATIQTMLAGSQPLAA